MDAVQKLLNLLTDIDSSLECLCSAVGYVIDDQRKYKYGFDNRGQFTGVVPKTDSTELSNEELEEANLLAKQVVEQISECTAAIWSAYKAANVATDELPQEVASKLDGLSGKPWVAMLRHNLLDIMVVWPGETLSYASRGSRKVSTVVPVFLQNLANRDPLPEWREFRATSRSLSRQLVAVWGSAKSEQPENEGEASGEGEAGEVPPDPTAYGSSTLLLSEKYPDQSKTKREMEKQGTFIDWRDGEKPGRIRKWKPSAQRLRFHLGDWHQYHVREGEKSDPSPAEIKNIERDIRHSKVR